MATIADNLQSIIAAKTAIKTAIKNKGIAIADTDALATYAGKIDSITAGGGSDDRLPSWLNNKITAVTADMFAPGQTVIPDYCFAYRPITSCDLPDSITTIGTYAFYFSSISSVRLPKNVSTIGTTNFSGCYYLQNIDLSATQITDLPSTSFSSCYKLSTVLLPKGLKTISGYGSFIHCTRLPSIDIPNTITYISTSTFNDCAALKTINVHYKTGATPYKAGAPWGATGATVNYVEDKED